VRRFSWFRALERDSRWPDLKNPSSSSPCTQAAQYEDLEGITAVDHCTPFCGVVQITYIWTHQIHG
jgi:hypothetical protein